MPIPLPGAAAQATAKSDHWPEMLPGELLRDPKDQATHNQEEECQDAHIFYLAESFMTNTIQSYPAVQIADRLKEST
jgi:hypothetical protein